MAGSSTNRAATAPTSSDPLPSYALRTVRVVEPDGIVISKAELLGLPRFSEVTISCVRGCRLGGRQTVKTVAGSVEVKALRAQALTIGAEVQFSIVMNPTPAARRWSPRVILRHRVRRTSGGAAFPRSAKVCLLDARWGRPPRSAPCSDGFELPVRNAADVAVAGGSVWVAGFATRSLTRFDARTGRRLAAVSVERGACKLANGYNWLWLLSCPGSDRQASVTRIDPSTGRITRVVPLGTWATWAGLAAGAGSIWASQYGRVVRVEPASGTVVGSVRIPDGWYPFVAGAGARIWASTFDGGMWAIDPGSMTARPVDLSAAGAIGPFGSPTNIWWWDNTIWAAGERVVSLSPDGAAATLSDIVLPNGAEVLGQAGDAVWVAPTRGSVIRPLRNGRLGAPVAVGGTAIVVDSYRNDLWVAHENGVTLVRGVVRRPS